MSTQVGPDRSASTSRRAFLKKSSTALVVGGTLALEKAEGRDIRVVYSPRDALKIAQENPGRQIIFLGVGLLSWPILRQGDIGDILAVIALLLAPLFWAIGSIWYQRTQTDLGTRAVSGWQQLLGGISFVVVVLIRGEPLPHPTGEAWLAWGYLALFGSVLAFTSYMVTLRTLPYGVVVTYAYVNPVIAVFLGWLILDEPVTRWTLGGAGLVIAGVLGIFQNRD